MARDEIMNPLLQKEGETKWQHHKRLVYGKLVDRTLADFDYAELSNYVYGEDFSADVARRMMYGSKRTIDLFETEQIRQAAECSPSTLIDEIDEKIISLRKEQQKARDQRRELGKLVSTEGRIENLHDTIIKAAALVNESTGLLFADNCFDPTTASDNEAVLVFSDWHYGMKTNNVFNEYNVEICRNRVRKVVEESIKRIVTHGCSKLHVVVLGDLVHGSIKIGTRVAAEENTCEQLMQASELLAEAIVELSKYVESVYVYTTYGNHARTVQNKKESVHRDNMERIVPWWLEQRMAACENIHIMPESENEFLFINACGHEICATHGDLDGVRIAPRLLTTVFYKRYGKNIEYILLGDKHHRESFNEIGVTASLCGSLCGTDDYANEKRLYSKPEQMLLIVDREYGVDAEYRIKC